MHFFKNSISFIAVMCVCGVAYSAARVSVTPTASRRMPSLTSVIKNKVATTAAVATASTTTSTTSNLLSDSDCIDDYRDCMKGSSACGSDFEECTTNVLFHGHMGECFSTLYQCSSTALNTLFGTSDISALSNVDSYVDGTNNTEVSRYVYPTDGSVMGIDVIGAATRNKLSTTDCVKKYKRCLAKDTICGEDFELCTSNEEFKKQAAMCDSTLSRCQKEGFQQLFGDNVTTKPSLRKLQPDQDGVITQWINDGATLAASNAVNTCYKVIDSCFTNACSKNPYHCIDGVNLNVIRTADLVGGEVSTTNSNNGGAEQSTASDVRKFFRAACQDTIGGNKYCFMTFKDGGGKTPTKSDLLDSDNQEDIFDEAYAARKSILQAKLQDAVSKFDTTAKNKCIDTFKSCAVRSCGGGSGAACYTRVFGAQATDKTINSSKVYKDISSGCAGVVNTDANCIYMAATTGTDGYTQAFSDDHAFETLFPEYVSGQTIPTIVASLNAELSTAYNDVAISKMKKQCQTVVSNCVKSMCGKDYKNCYRNRNDIRVATYSTESEQFNKSMNKVGGVLDYTIVQGLCMSTVKSADACEESLAIAKASLKESETSADWGNSTTVSNAWRSSGDNYGYNVTMTEMVPATDANGKKLCKCPNGGNDVCAFEDGGNIECQETYLVEKDVQLSNAAATSLFQTVLADIELEAQAKYNSKLTHEQHVCLAQNTGANPDPTFVWAKLKSSKKPSKDYSSLGLKDSSMASNDLYSSFCRVKVTLQSEDSDVQKLIANGEGIAYFAVGDPFTCGSWMSSDSIEKMSKTVAEKQTGTDEDGSLTSGQKWGVAGVTALSTILGGVGTDLLQTKTGLGGLLGTTDTRDNKKVQDQYSEKIGYCAGKAQDVQNKADIVISHLNQKTPTGEGTAAATTTSSLTKQDIRNLGKAINELKASFTTLKTKFGSDYEWSNEFSKYANLEAGSANTDAQVAIAQDIKTEAGNVATACNTMMSSEKYTSLTPDDDKNFWNNGGGRAVMDIAGGAILGTAGGITTAQIMKANNRSDFTEAQQKWINEFGSKIHCYVGGELVGSFGDIVSVNITEEE